MKGITEAFPRCPKCGSRNLLYPLGLVPKSDEAYIECEDCGYKWYAEAFDGSKRREELKTVCEEERIRIICHTCDGKGVVTELTWPDRREVEVACWECDGRGWIYAKPKKDSYRKEAKEVQEVSSDEGVC